jgi:hypothetical protein
MLLMLASGSRAFQADLQAELFLDLQEGFGVAPRVVDGMVGVLRIPQVLEVDEHERQTPP